MRSPLIAGNWKMNGSSRLIDEFVQVLGSTPLPKHVETVMAPPFPFLAEAKEKLSRFGIEIGAQTLNPQTSGAFTGEVSGPMLSELGVRFVIVGHSERRRLYHESDEDVVKRAQAALSAGLRPILCVGETLDQRDTGHTLDVVLRQVDLVMASLEAEQRFQLAIAYEPVWAIGSGRTAGPVEAQQVMGGIREYLSSLDPDLGSTLRLLYGGSLNADNACELLSQPDIDGGLVGGASLKVTDFLTICNEAS